MTPRLTALAHDAVRAVVRPGDVVIDATVGNGHDTLFLSDLVGPTGSVFGFDIQPAALAAAANRLADRSNVRLILADHVRLNEHVPAAFHGRVAAVLFNLGYRPGGDHTVTTRAETTLPALAATVPLIRPGGVLTVVAYRGHRGGTEETDAVRTYLSSLSADQFERREYPSPGESGPVLFCVIPT